jgi:hypothetical protein
VFRIYKDFLDFNNKKTTKTMGKKQHVFTDTSQKKIGKTPTASKHMKNDSYY